jgi:hypothetical protein
MLMTWLVAPFQTPALPRMAGPRNTFIFASIEKSPPGETLDGNILCGLNEAGVHKKTFWICLMYQLQLSPPPSNNAVIFTMWSNPEPNDVRTLLNCNCSIVKSNPNRPISANLLEMK